MVRKRRFEVVLSPDAEGGYSVFVPELPSVATQGETREEALAMATEAIEGYLEVMAEDGLPIPPVERGRVAVNASATASPRSPASKSSRRLKRRAGTSSASAQPPHHAPPDTLACATRGPPAWTLRAGVIEPLIVETPGIEPGSADE